MHNEILLRLTTIGEVAQRIGIHIETVRRWERPGILPPATRRRGSRVYGQEDVAHIEATVFEAPRERQECR
jgi:DNA-binding transcriptional MerR regulator